MNLNLNVPWDDKCAAPQTSELVFYSNDDETMIFEKGKKIEIVCQAGLRSVGLTWTLHRNMIDKPFRQAQAEAMPGNRFNISVDTNGLHPGFYDLKVVLDTGMAVATTKDDRDKRPIRGVCTFGWKPEEMAIRETRPADFLAFWDKALLDYAEIPMDPKIESAVTIFKGKQMDEYNVKSACLPPNYDPEGCKYDEVESFKISFAGPDGGRVYAWLAKPREQGTFPAMLVLPGAGFASRPRPLEHARHGYLAMDIQVHGQDVDLAKYDEISGYQTDNVFEPVQKHYFRNLYLRAIRAVDYLSSRSDVDSARLVAVGGSQGGRLAVVVSALNPKVTASVPCIAWAGNYPHLLWTKRCNGLNTIYDNSADLRLKDPPKCDGMDMKGAPPVVDEARWRCEAYYDPMNFAPYVKCAVLMNAGLIDPCSPAYGVWSIYNRLGSRDKRLVPLPGLGHDWSAEFDRCAWRWLEHQFGRTCKP